MRTISSFILLSLVIMPVFGLSPARALGTGLKIAEVAVTTKIVKGKPIDSVHRISSASVNALYCFTRTVSNSDDEKLIRHIWFKDNEKIAEFDLPVNGKRWRTFSKKAIDKGSVGNWRVDIIDGEGMLLKSVHFRMN